jgi:uncharacterized repeat protein (TIGR03803 family)
MRAANAALALATMLVAAILATGSARAQTYAESVLYSFCAQANCADGQYPATILTRDSAGNLYGTTFTGGQGDCGGEGCGVVFKLDTSGNYTVLYSFTGGNDGGAPSGGVTLDPAGTLYGTTYAGGLSKYGPGDCFYNTYGCGVAFKLDTAGNYTVLYSFCGQPNCTDGANPKGNLLRDSTGNLYGIASGTDVDAPPSVAFRLAKNGKYTVLYTFAPGSWWGDNGAPGLVSDSAGNLYGATPYGGADGAGAVFKLDTAGTYTALYSFTGGADGGNPVAGVIRDSAGNLFGTAYGGGANGGGVAFKLETDGTYTVLYNFCSNSLYCGDGYSPDAGLVRDAAGNLYGTAPLGGQDGGGYGVAFKLTAADNYKVLYSFSLADGANGGNPTGGVILDSAGNLYGTASDGGAHSGGAIFKLTLLTVTTNTLSSSLNPSTQGQAVTFTAAVTSKNGAPPNGETVSFMNGKATLGTGTLSAGSASFTTSTLKVGTHSITAVYAGDATFAASTSKPVKQVVNQAAE